MRQDHRVVEQEGVLFVAVDEVTSEVAHHIGQIFSIFEIFLLPIDFKPAIRVATWAPRELPQRILIETELSRPSNPPSNCHLPTTQVA